MASRDRWGEPLSTANSASADAFAEAVTLLNGFYLDPLARIDSALAADPDFVMGHLLRASLFMISSERAGEAPMQQSLAAAARLANRANERERGHMAAIGAWAAGDFHQAAHRYTRVLAAYPRDILALQVAHQCDFFLGQSEMLRDRVAWVLPAWTDGTPGRGFVLGMHAFGLEETNLFAAAEAAGQEALALNPRDPWAVHALAHVCEMQGRTADGIDLLTRRAADWADDNMFAFHNWWHLALFHLDRGETAEVLRLYDRFIRPQPSAVALEMVDAAALLWRLRLRGVAVGARWEELADGYEGMIEDGYYVFNDMHAAMALLATGRAACMERLIGRLERAAAEAGSNGAATRDVGLPVVRALAAFEAGRYAEAADMLLAVRPAARRLGGSNAQRDVISATIAEAAVRSGDRGLARLIAAERLALKPDSPANRALAARVN